MGVQGQRKADHPEAEPREDAFDDNGQEGRIDAVYLKLHWLICSVLSGPTVHIFVRISKAFRVWRAVLNGAESRLDVMVTRVTGLQAHDQRVLALELQTAQQTDSLLH
jgi:hypothetical protein